MVYGFVAAVLPVWLLFSAAGLSLLFLKLHHSGIGAGNCHYGTRIKMPAITTSLTAAGLYLLGHYFHFYLSPSPAAPYPGFTL